MLAAILLAAAITNTPLSKITSVGYDLPKHLKKNVHYVFYVHGRLIENRGLHPHDDRFGDYEYLDILKTLQSRGVQVIAEARPQNTEPRPYARARRRAR
jgi:hypothetical protein